MPRWPAFVCLILLAAMRIAAQSPLPGAGGLADRSERSPEGHAWVVSPAVGSNEAYILHLPPRFEAGAEPGASDGTARRAAALPNMPEALAAWQNRVFMVFPAQPVRPGVSLRPVLTSATIHGPIGGQWGPDHEGRRLPALPSLPGDGHLVGFVGTPHGPAALLRRAGGEGKRLELLVLVGSAWREASLPAKFLADAAHATANVRMGLVADSRGLGIYLAGDSPGNPDAGLWTGVIDRSGDALEVAWTRSVLHFAAADGSPAPLPDSALFHVAHQYAYAARTGGGGGAGGGLEIWSLVPAHSPDGAGALALRLAHLPNVSREWAAAPMDDVGRLAVVWFERVPARTARIARPADGANVAAQAGEPGEGDGSIAQATADSRSQEIRRQIAEVSIYTGAVLYEGAVRVSGPVSAQELRLLAVVVVALMAVIVVFVLRPEPKGPPLILPAGYALAEPGRRIAASLVDLLAAAFIAGQIMDVGLWELLTLRGILLPGGVGLSAILAVIGIGFLMTTLGEWLTGRTLGKFITGCEVVRPVIDRTAEGQVVPSVQLPGPWRAAARNLVKWTIPPVALAGLGTPERRHRGDTTAGTAVVVRIEEPEPA